MGNGILLYRIMSTFNHICIVTSLAFFSIDEHLPGHDPFTSQWLTGIFQGGVLLLWPSSESSQGKLQRSSNSISPQSIKLCLDELWPRVVAIKPWPRESDVIIQANILALGKWVAVLKAGHDGWQCNCQPPTEAWQV